MSSLYVDAIWEYLSALLSSKCGYPLVAVIFPVLRLKTVKKQIKGHWIHLVNFLKGDNFVISCSVFVNYSLLKRGLLYKNPFPFAPKCVCGGGGGGGGGGWREGGGGGGGGQILSF